LEGLPATGATFGRRSGCECFGVHIITVRTIPAAGITARPPRLEKLPADGAVGVKKREQLTPARFAPLARQRLARREAVGAESEDAVRHRNILATSDQKRGGGCRKIAHQAGPEQDQDRWNFFEGVGFP
jgi:hypothetical protein